ncbi:ADP-ribosylation factor-like protein 10 isoform X1 [Nannospalax galili]|uniref:ADP-ribosylation factor-like protein 10 isoform X1 n=1 Tax=Nannospalax galili TaxID=1026970 RepID=UPI0004ED605B|nr:ADP-ribosylation factor-like protein 10 isoform X1 [Nannospalax galili]XP_029426381.1 ADP-ribosylation factor-like protein 10 isoform X1 [Nannospalax galili]
MAPRPLGPLVLALGGAAAVLGSVLFILWKAYFGRGRERRWDRGEAWWGAEPARLPQWDEWEPEDEEDEPALEELEQREVLVLGLDGSGKSTFLRVLSGKPPLEGHIPTWGFNSVRLPTKDFEVDLLEIGGSQNLRFYWKEFVNEVDVLVFMVDSADRLRLPWARQELQKLLDKDPDLPVVVVANKQNLTLRNPAPCTSGNCSWSFSPKLEPPDCHPAMETTVLLPPASSSPASALGRSPVAALPFSPEEQGQKNAEAFLMSLKQGDGKAEDGKRIMTPC